MYKSANEMIFSFENSTRMELIMEFSKEWYHTELVNSEYDMLHRSPTVEYSFYNAVKTGDMETVIRNCKEDAFIDLKGTGVLSRNPITNIKYHFICRFVHLSSGCLIMS